MEIPFETLDVSSSLWMAMQMPISYRISLLTLIDCDYRTKKN